MSTEYTYQGDELDLFREATVWKRYYSSRLTRHIFGDVLEVGAGIGGTTPYLLNSNVSSVTQLEPDKENFSKLEAESLDGVSLVRMNGTLDDLDRSFDSIAYIDVLEHIEDDSAEMQKASSLLNQGGNIVILSPAHSFLYSEFDKKVGHYRRYNKSMMKNVCPGELRISLNMYLDSVGLLASLANSMLLRQNLPTARQISIWDKGMVPASRLLDPLLGHSIGKSLLTVLSRD